MRDGGAKQSIACFSLSEPMIHWTTNGVGIERAPNPQSSFGSCRPETGCLGKCLVWKNNSVASLFCSLSLWASLRLCLAFKIISLPEVFFKIFARRLHFMISIKNSLRLLSYEVIISLSASLFFFFSFLSSLSFFFFLCFLVSLSLFLRCMFWLTSRVPWSALGLPDRWAGLSNATKSLDRATIDKPFGLN